MQWAPALCVTMIAPMVSAMSARAEPVTVRGVDHVAVTVPDIDEATAFFKNTFACEAFYRVGPYPEVGEFGKMLDVPPETELVGFQLMRCGSGANIEIFEYKHPNANIDYPRNSDRGGHHIAFYVDDLDREIKRLQRMGITVLGDAANMNGDGPHAGSRWIYFKAPWGLTLELVSYPDGMAYEKTTEKRLWDPRYPSR